ncbi:MAG: peptidase MA family metallohydrolase [Anaerolineales bacterium]|nr:peptidase MA family metallohydrolase [Anaerolineales bacterium]
MKKNHPALFPVIFVACLMLAQPVFAQSQINLKEVNAAYDFGQTLTLSAEIETSQTVSQAQVFLRAEGESHTITFPARIDSSGRLQAIHDIQQAQLRPFAEITYWFRFFFADGTSADSPQFSFRYTDNRFNWQTLADGNLRVHWYAGDLAFGQAALDAARSGAERTSRLLSKNISQPIDIYIYANSNDLKATIDASGRAWVGGHASPDLNIVFVSIQPGAEQSINMERKIPHELAHILTYVAAGERYPLLPIWLREGIATISEIYPSPDYARSLAHAVEADGLLSFKNLCGDFPVDASSRFLAYAQSESFTRYLVDQYGISSLGRLIEAYGDGLGCEQAVQHALGVSLTDLEYSWRAERLGEDRLALAVKNLSGYWILFGVLLILPLTPAIFLPAKKN